MACEIIEVDMPSESPEEDLPIVSLTKPRKPLTGAAREKALENLAKARAARAANVAAKKAAREKEVPEYQVRNSKAATAARREQKRALMLEREGAMLRAGRRGYGPADYSEDEDFSEDYDSEEEMRRRKADRPMKTYRVTGGRPRKDGRPTPRVSGRDLSNWSDSSEEEDYDSPPPARSRKAPRAAKPRVKKPSIKDQRIDFLERKMNEILGTVAKRTIPSKKVTHNTIVMPAERPAEPIPVPKPRAPDPALAKKAENVLRFF